MKRRSKYGIDTSAAGKAARTIMHKGKEIRCASKFEAKKLAELVLREKAGEISALELHPIYYLPGKIRYVADAQFVERRDHTGPRSPSLVVFEVKGYETAVWRLKKKLFSEKFPTVELRVVKA